MAFCRLPKKSGLKGFARGAKALADFARLTRRFRDCVTTQTLRQIAICVSR